MKKPDKKEVLENHIQLLDNQVPYDEVLFIVPEGDITFNIADFTDIAEGDHPNVTLLDQILNFFCGC